MASVEAASRAVVNVTFHRSATIAAAVLTATPLLAPAANYYWDPTTTASTNGGGAGTWNKTLTNWYTGTSDVIWTDGNTAIFGNTGGAVTLSTAISAANLQLSGTGYTIAPSATNTLTLTSNIVNGTPNPITGSAIYASGSTNNIAGPLILAGSATSGTATYLTAASGATLNLTGTVTANNSGTSGTTIYGPGLVTYSGTSFTPGKFNVLGGATFSSAGSMSGFTQTYVGVGDTTASTWNINTGSVINAGLTLFIGGGSNVIGTVAANGGSATFSAVNVGNSYNNATDAAGNGTLTIGGGTLTNSGATTLGGGLGVGVLNLNSGSYNTTAINKGVVGTGNTSGSATINFNGATLTLSATGGIGATVDSKVLAGGAIIGNALSNTIASALTTGVSSGTDGGLIKTAAGVLTLGGVNTYTGPTVVSAGTLAFANASGTTQTLKGSISGSGTINQIGAGTTILTGSNTFYGVSIVSAGTLAGVGANAFGANYVQIAAGTLSLRGDANTTFANSSTGVPTPVFTTTTGATINADQATAAGTGAKTMTIGTVTTSVNAAAYSLSFTGSNNTSLTTGAISGPASPAAGTVIFINTIASPSVLTIGSYAGKNTSGGETLTFSGTGVSTVSGAITPSSTTLSLVKSDSGVLTLNGASTFNGGVTIAGTGADGTALNGGGTLILANSAAAGNGAVTVNGYNANTGTLGLTGGITLANSVTLTSSRNDPTSTGTTSAAAGSAHIRNISGSNTIGANGFAIAGGGLGNIIQSDAGTLTFTGILSGNTSGSQYARPYFLTGTGSGVISGVIANGSSSASTGTSIVKYGTGMWTLGGKNTYQSGTTINSGLIRAENSTASLGTGTTFVGGSTAAGTSAMSGTGVLAGNGATGGPVIVGAFSGTGVNGVSSSTTTTNTGGVITAGSGAQLFDAAGKLTTGNETWGGGGQFTAKFASATGTGNATVQTGGTSGTWDALAMGTLNLAQLSSANRFVLQVLKTGSFDTSTQGHYQLASTGAITLKSGSSTVTAGGNTDLTSLFALDTSTLGLSNTSTAKYFTVSSGADGTGLILNVDPQPAPEPMTTALLGLGGSALLGRRRSRSGRDASRTRLNQFVA